MSLTGGIHHLGLSVRSLDETMPFFVEGLGWQESGRDESYPRTAVSDGVIRLTLWQVDATQPVVDFDRRSNIGLHHLALQVKSRDRLNEVARIVSEYPGAEVEFLPQNMGAGPRVHMMCREPGGLRIEFVWPG